MLVRFGNDETSIVPPSLGELVPQVMLVTLDGEERVSDGEEAFRLAETLLVRAVDAEPNKAFTAPVKTARKPVIVPDKPEAKAHSAFSRGHTSVEPRYTAMTSVVPFSIFLA